MKNVLFKCQWGRIASLVRIYKNFQHSTAIITENLTSVVAINLINRNNKRRKKNHGVVVSPP